MSYLFIHKFYALFYGHFFDNSEHKHHAIQWCRSTKGNIVLSFNEEKIVGESFLIAPDTPHKAISGEGELFMLFIDPDTIVGKAIMKKYLKSESFVIKNIPRFSGLYKEYSTASELRKAVKNLLESLDTVHTDSIDPRIIKSLKVIENNPQKNITVPQIANEICLSESRLQHLFKENVGIPIQSFLLWKRIISAVQLTQKTNDLTSIAYNAGFSDSAHFSRSFKQMFGVQPKELFKALGSVEVVFIE